MPTNFMVAVKHVSGGVYYNSNGIGLTDIIELLSCLSFPQMNH